MRDIMPVVGCLGILVLAGMCFSALLPLLPFIIIVLVILALAGSFARRRQVYNADAGHEEEDAGYGRGHVPASEDIIDVEAVEVHDEDRNI